jgi:AAA domain
VTAILARFRFIDEAPGHRTFRPLRPQLFEVEEHETGREYALKLWQKTGTERDEDLRLIWRHEMRQVERVMATAGAQEIIVDVLEVLEDESYFGILLDHTGSPLEALLESAPRNHWLRNLDTARARTLLWRNAIQLAHALGLVHAQGLVHGRLDSAAVVTEGSDSPDFRLTRFEWSLWLQEDAVSPAHYYDGGTDTQFSYATDWKSLGELLGKLLAVPVNVLGESEPPLTEEDSRLMPAERRLLKRLVEPDKSDLLEADAVVQEINDLIVGIGRDMATRDGGFILTFHPRSKLSEVIYDASYGDIEHAQYRAQLDWVRSDLMNGTTLLVPREFDSATSEMRLVSNTMVYTIGPLREHGTPVWDIAICTKIAPRRDRLTLDATEHELPQTIEIAKSVREAQDFRVRMGTAVLDWSAFSVGTKSALAVSAIDLVRQALLLVQAIELFMKRLEIYPIEIGTSPQGSPGRRVYLRARGGGERDRIAEQIGMPNGEAALRFIFEHGRSDAATPWIISTSPTVGQRLHGDVTARFVGRVDSDEGYFYCFEVDETLPRDGPLYLKSTQDAGTDAALRRRLKNIRALGTRSDLVEMLTDPWRARRLGREKITEAEQAGPEFKDLDSSKQQALLALWSTLPGFSVVGPPGVGKTHLATETIRRAFARGRATRMLVSSQGHDALDNLQSALNKALCEAKIEDLVIVRSTPPESRPGGAQDVQRRAAQYLLDFKESALATTAPPLLKERIAALARAAQEPQDRQDSLTREDRAGVRAVSTLVLDAANIVLSSLNSADIENMVDAREQFDWVIVEEAAKATGPELIGTLLLSSRRLLIGDHRQLPPFQSDHVLKLLSDPNLIMEAISHARRTEGSLLDESDVMDLRHILRDQRILEDAAERARKLFEPFRYIVEEDKRRGGTRISKTLTEQRRMDPAIADIVSRTFYEGELTTDAVRAELEQHGARRFRQLPPLPASPVVVVDFPHVSTTGRAAGFEQSYAGWRNPTEVEAVLNVLSCVRAKRGKRPKLAVLSPYGSQVDLIDERLSAVIDGPLSHLKHFQPARGDNFVGTVDSFQGSEADLVVLSLVRNNPRVGGSALGFLRDRRRINVALSRAMSQLVIVGSLSFLQEAVRGVNPKEEEHDLSFFTDILNTIQALTLQQRKDGVPLAAILPMAELKHP